MVLVSRRTSTIRRGSVQTVLTRFNNVNSLYWYIGSTTHALHTRAREHLYAIKNKDSSSALGEHYQLHHPITFQILGTSGGSELRLRTMEARIIQKLQPNLNRKKRTHGPRIPNLKSLLNILYQLNDNNIITTNLFFSPNLFELI